MGSSFFSRKLSLTKIILRLSLFLIYSFANISTSSSAPPSTFKSDSNRPFGHVVLQLKWFHQFNFAGYYAAVEKGFYEKNGLEVTIREGRPGMDFINEVVSERANYGVEMPELLIARNNGKPVVVLAAIFQHSPQILLARADSGIKSPHNLIGKKVMWRFDSAAELRAMLINENVSLDQIEFSELSWDINDLINRNVDAIHAYVTDQPLMLKKAGIASSILYPINYGIDFYGDCLFTSEKELSKHPDRVKAFRAASLQGWAYAMDNPEEIMAIIRKKYDSKSSMEYMRNEFEHMNTLMLPKFIEIGHMNPGRWKHIGDTFLKLGMLEPDYSLDGFLYDPHLQPDFTNVMRFVWILLCVMLIIFISVIILVIYNRKLNKMVLERTKHLSTEIVERQHAEQSVIQEKKRLLITLQSIGDGVITTNTLGQIDLINKVAETMTGWTQKEAQGKDITEVFNIINAKTGKRAENPVEKILKTKTIVELDNHTKLIARDGTEKMIADSGAPIFDSNHEIIGTILVFRDVTEKLKIEKHLQQSQKMEAIGTLAGGIAHDFNNMLGVIIGNISYALSNVKRDDELFEILSDVQESSKQAQSLTHQLLTFSKGGAPIKKSSDINRLINETAIFLTRGAQSNCNFKLSEDLLPAEVDEGQFNQVVANLIINANQAMPNGGSILIKTENVDIDVNSSIPLSAGRYIKIVVEDQGVGISKKHLPNIFEPYYTTKQQGSGLGLATAYSIIKRHGGHIAVYSEIDKGTVFSIYLPASLKEIDEIKNKEEHKHFGQGKILIMDDQESISKMVIRLLNKMGYEATSVRDGGEAIKIYSEAYDAGKPFDLVILDLTIPGGMGGAKTIPKLLKIDPNVKAVVSSGYSNDPIMANYEDYGFCGIVPKPYTKQQLSEVLNKIFS